MWRTVSCPPIQPAHAWWSLWLLSPDQRSVTAESDRLPTAPPCLKTYLERYSGQTVFLLIQPRPQGLLNIQNGDSEKTLANSRPPNRHFEYHEEAEDDVATYELEYFNKRINCYTFPLAIFLYIFLTFMINGNYQLLIINHKGFLEELCEMKGHRSFLPVVLPQNIPRQAFCSAS